MMLRNVAATCGTYTCVRTAVTRTTGGTWHDSTTGVHTGSIDPTPWCGTCNLDDRTTALTVVPVPPAADFKIREATIIPSITPNHATASWHD